MLKKQGVVENSVAFVFFQILYAVRIRFAVERKGVGTKTIGIEGRRADLVNVKRERESVCV